MNKALVKAWSFSHYENGVRMERLYCEWNGQIYATQERAYSNSFANAGDVWTLCPNNSVPPMADWIGQYPKPSGIGA